MTAWSALVVQVRECLIMLMEYSVSGFWAFSGELSELGEELSKARGIWSFVIRIFHNNTSANNGKQFSFFMIIVETVNK